MSSTKKKTDAQILKEIEASVITSNALVIKAMKAHEEEEEQRKIEQIKSKLLVIENFIEENIEKLRCIRKSEAAQKQRLINIGKAKEAFMKNADWDACNKALRNA